MHVLICAYPCARCARPCADAFAHALCSPMLRKRNAHAPRIMRLPHAPALALRAACLHIRPRIMQCTFAHTDIRSHLGASAPSPCAAHSLAQRSGRSAYVFAQASAPALASSGPKFPGVISLSSAISAQAKCIGAPTPIPLSSLRLLRLAPAVRQKLARSSLKFLAG